MDTPSTAADTDHNVNPLSFETALQQLQAVVTRLEDGGDGLEASLADFEQGIRLLRECYRRLDDAERKIEQLVRIGENGEAVLTSFDATATAGQPAGKRRATRKPAAVEPRPASGGQLGFDDAETP